MPAPRGVPKVEVTFDIDANGILSRPREGHGDRQGSEDHDHRELGGLNEDEIQKMVKEAAEHEAEDKERREQIERRNKLDNLCYTLEKTLAENKDKLPGADVATLEGLIKEGREAVEKQDDDEVKDVREKLEKEAHRIASVMYGASGPRRAGGRRRGRRRRRPPARTARRGGEKKGGRRRRHRRRVRRGRRELIMATDVERGSPGRAPAPPRRP